ncbi:MAG: DNA primase [Lachnospiraceae bacterium]|nr:DNA primase [Lachnospiraceae bacterium]
MYYPEELVEEVRQKNDIVDVVSGYVRIKQKGANYVGLCPFHNEKTGSFSVSPSRQIFKCFGCGIGGNVFTFVMQYENYTFVEAMKMLAERAGIKLPEAEYDENAKKAMNKKARIMELNKDAANYFYFQLRAPQGEVGMKYFKNRELSDEIMKKFALGYANVKSDDLVLYLKSKGYTDNEIVDSGVASFHEKYGLHDKFWNRVMFPIQDINNKVIGFGGRVIGEGEPKYLNSPETVVFDKSRNLYGMNFARTSRKGYLILCEGYMDVIAMHQAGFTEAVASLGTAFTGGQAAILRRYADQIILAYDSDGAGTKAALRAIDILRNYGMTGRILHLEPYKDPDEFIKNLGREAFEERIQNAEDSFRFELRMMEKGYDLKSPESKLKFRKALVEKMYTLSDQFEDIKPFIELVCETYHFGYDEMCSSVASYGNSSQAKMSTVRRQEETEVKRNKKKEDPVLYNQKVLLTWLVDEPSLYGKIKDYISVDDFSEGIYRKAAERLMQALENGEVPNPGAIMTSLQASEETNEEEQLEIASLFCTKITDKLSRMKGTAEVDLDAQAKIFDSVSAKGRALSDILVTVKRATMQRVTDHANADPEAFKKIVSIKKTIEKIQKTHISLT